MGNLWIRLGCFVTGYNYSIVRNSSEVCAKTVKKYLSAILIVSIMWAFIGYVFTQRYLHGGTLESLFGAAIMVIIVIQIERQIILGDSKSKTAVAFRAAIGIVMAIIGSVILDQIMYKDDIEKAKINMVQMEVDSILPIKTRLLTAQVQQLEIDIQNKEKDRADIMGELASKPFISTPTTVNHYVKDTATGKMIQSGRVETKQSQPNPRGELIKPIDDQLKFLREQKIITENTKWEQKKLLDEDIKSKVGFLDELKILFSILTNSGIALTIWILIFFLFLAIELFVLASKIGDRSNDYDKTVTHQMEVRMEMLDKLAVRGSNGRKLDHAERN